MGSTSESVFSGMAKGIIHNSDYPSAEAAKEAIDRYFKERNDHFSNARSAPDERPGGRSGCQASFPKQTTAKIRCTANRVHLEAGIESVPRPADGVFTPSP